MTQTAAYRYREYLGVSQMTASKMITRLRREGLVENRRYRSIFLTETGRQMADTSCERHRVRIPSRAEDGRRQRAPRFGRIERHVSDEPLERLRDLTRTMLAGSPAR